MFGAVGRSFSPSHSDQFAGHQHDAERRRPGERPAELEPAGGAGHPHTSLQSVLELDRTHQIHGAIQEEKEKDHPRGNLVSVFLHFPPPPRLKSFVRDYLSTVLSDLNARV